MKKKISVNPVFRAGDFIISHDKKRIGRIKFVTVTIDSKGGQKFDFSAVFPEKGEGWETLEVWPEEGGVVNIDTEDWTLFDTRSEAEMLAADLELLTETLHKLCHLEAATKLNNLIAELRGSSDNPF